MTLLVTQDGVECVLSALPQGGFAYASSPYRKVYSLAAKALNFWMGASVPPNPQDPLGADLLLKTSYLKGIGNMITMFIVVNFLHTALADSIGQG